MIFRHEYRGGVWVDLEQPSEDEIRQVATISAESADPLSPPLIRLIYLRYIRARSIIGFFLGYPRSAVNAYGNKQISEPRGVDIEGPNGGRAFYFTTDVQLAEADDVKALAERTRNAFDKAGLGQFFRDKNGT